MENILQDLAYRIIGELMTCEKYKFIDGKLLAEIVKDVIKLLDKGEE